jgi:hypothetical protein
VVLAKAEYREATRIVAEEVEAELRASDSTS